LTAAQGEHTRQRITKGSTHDGRRNKSGEPIRIPQLTTTQSFTHPEIVTDFCEDKN